MFFIRAVESLQEAEISMNIGKSVDGWGLIGMDAYTHFNEHPYRLRPLVLHKLGYEMELTKEGNPTSKSIILMEKLLNEKPIEKWSEKEIARGLNLIPLSSGGYIRYLNGLCSLQSFQSLPKPEECTITFPDNNVFPYLVCFEGDLVGTDIDTDWDIEWELFKPKKIIWIHPIGSENKRLISIFITNH